MTASSEVAGLLALQIWITGTVSQVVSKGWYSGKLYFPSPLHIDPVTCELAYNTRTQIFVNGTVPWDWRMSLGLRE